MTAAGYAPCAHQGLFLHYAEFGFATGLAAGIAAGVAASVTAVLVARGVRKLKDGRE